MTDHRWQEGRDAIRGPVWAIVVAAGSSSRFGSAKLAGMIAGISVLDRSLTHARAHADGVVLVRSAHTPRWSAPVDRDVEGGATRSASVRCGIAAVPDDAAIIVVHDAARPLAAPSLFAAVIRAVREGADAAITATPVVDTVKRVQGDRVVATLDRSELVAVQTPQAFRAGALRAAHVGASEATDDAALVERDGGTVVVAAGDARNIKITVPHDLAVVELLAASFTSGDDS